MDFPFTLTPGQTITVNSRQAYLYYEAGSAGGADASVRVSADIGDEIVLKPGQGFRYSGPFNRLYLSNNKGQATIIGHIVMEAGEFFDNRVTGSVEVIDGGKARTLANAAFLTGCSVVAGAGQKPHVQLWNPVGSGKNLMVEAIIASGSATASLLLGTKPAAMATLYTPSYSKKLNNGTGTAEGRTSSPAAYDYLYQMMSLGLQANQVLSYKFTEPIVVTPGNGMVLALAADAGSLGVTFEHFEEAL